MADMISGRSANRPTAFGGAATAVKPGSKGGAMAAMETTHGGGDLREDFVSRVSIADLKTTVDEVIDAEDLCSRASLEGSSKLSLSLFDTLVSLQPPCLGRRSKPPI